MDDSRSEVQILEYLSECLRIFRKRLMQMIKINQKGTSQAVVQTEDNFEKTTQQGQKLIQQFPKITNQFSKLETILSRFASRVKEIVNTSQLKSTSGQISNYLIFLSTLLKESISPEKIHILLKYMLIKSPHIIQGLAIGLNKPEEKYFQSEKNTPIKIKNNPHSLKNSQKTLYYSLKNQERTQSYLDNHEKFVQALERQYKLYNGLGMDQSEYRRKFFLARQDHHRKDTNLYEDMLFRNRFTQQIFLNYKNDFERYSKKIQAKKNKQKQSPSKCSNFLKQQLTSYSVKQSIKTNQSEKIIETSSNGSSFKNQAKKMKTQNYEKIGISAGDIVINNKSKQGDKGSTFFPRRKKFKTHFATCLSTDEFFTNQKIFEYEKSKNICRGGNLMELKKINFLGSKIELMPETIEQKQILRIDRKKNLCKRTQQHLKKKISVISQPKVISKSCLNTVSPVKQKNFTPLLIDYSRLLK